MRSIGNSPPLKNSEWEELKSTQLDSTQSDQLKVQLDLLLWALEALAGTGTDAILQAAAYLHLESQLATYITPRPPSSDSLHAGEASRQKLDGEAARSLVLIICHLAKQHQELIRRAITLLEQLEVERRSPHDVALLGDYLDTFDKIYQERWLDKDRIIAADLLHKVALKLLVELLFYSGPGGHRRLWSLLLSRLT